MTTTSARKRTPANKAAKPAVAPAKSKASPGTPRGKRPQSEIKRKRILDAAAEAFWRRGYAEATLNDIAELAGTQAGSLYYYFDSRESLVEEVLRLSMTTVFDDVRKVLDDAPHTMSWLERIRLGIKAHVRSLFDQNPYTRAYLKIIDQVPEDVRRRYLIFPRSYGRYWSEIFRAAQESGELRSDVDLSAARMLVFGSATFALEWFNPNGQLNAEQLADQLCLIFLEGLRAPPVIAEEPAPRRKRKPAA